MSAVNRCTFTVRLLLRKIDVEHVNLVVSTYDIAFFIYQEAPVKNLVVRAVDGDRADENEPAFIFGKSPEPL